jgi:diacylglycerol kinase family enzyme
MFLLVGNPTSQSGRNRERIDRARTIMDGSGLRHDFLPTSAGGLTISDVTIALRTRRYDAVVAMGGDGTFREVAAGVIRSGVDVPMGMLPTGTANDQGRSFGLSASPSALAANIAVLAAGYTAPLDAGRITSYDDLDNATGQDWFFDSLGWGLSARVLKVRNEDRQIVSNVPILRALYRDQLVYAGAIVQALLAGYLDEQRFEAEVVTPEGNLFYEGLTDLILKNTRYYAGAWIFDDTASPEDGAMELVPMMGRNQLFARLVVNNEQIPVNAPDVEPVLPLAPIVRATSFFVRPRERAGATAVDVQIDGEEFPTAAAYRIEVVRHALRIIIPRR